MVCASIRFKSSTLPESCASRLLSSRMICRYSRCSSGVTSSSSSRSAKPLMLTMGVLNSWEKLFTKSLRSSSVPESSSAALLKAALNSRISVGSYPWAAGCRRTVKSPAASRFIACMMFLIGFINTRRIATTRLTAIKIQLAYKITSAPPMLMLPSWIKKPWSAFDTTSTVATVRFSVTMKNRFSTSSIVKFTVRTQSRSLFTNCAISHLLYSTVADAANGL